MGRGRSSSPPSPRSSATSAGTGRSTEAASRGSRRSSSSSRCRARARGARAGRACRAGDRQSGSAPIDRRGRDRAARVAARPGAASSGPYDSPHGGPTGPCARRRARPLGPAAVAVLRARGVEVVGYDADPAVAAEALDADLRLGAWEDEILDGVGLLVKSPGVPSSAEPIVAARARSVPVISEIELGARLLPNPLLGVTGTNGKTTTTALLGAMFEAAGRPVEVAGNIGRPLTALVDAVDPDAWIVCELSSFQLEDVETLRPRVAVLTNLEPDHLDRHGSFEAYAPQSCVPSRVRGRTTSPSCRAASARCRARLDASSSRTTTRCPPSRRFRGAHNRENAAAAAAAARAIGVPDAAIAEALRAFPGVEHRIEEVGDGRRRPLRERLEGDERRRRSARACVVPRAAQARDPRWPREGRAVRRACGRVRAGRPRVPDRRGGG